MVIPLAVTIFEVPTFLLANVAVPLTTSESPASRLSAYVTDAESVASYVLCDAVMVTLRFRAVISAVVVGAPDNESV